MNCKHEFNELCCKPKARCFKGLAILSMIYAMGAFIMALVIPLVVKSHGGDDDPDIKDRMHMQLISSIIIGLIMLGISVLNWIVFAVYRTKEQARRSVIEQFADERAEYDD